MLTLTLTAALAAAAASTASAAVTRASAQTAVSQRATIEISSALTLPSMTALATGQANSTGLVLPVASTTTLRLSGDAGQAVSLSVPESFSVVRTADGGVIVPAFESGLISGNSLSVNVAGIVALAPQAMITDSYSDFIAVVAQYN